MLAFVFAIGMVAFTAPEITEESEVQSDYILLENNSWRAIPEQNCQGNAQTCKVQLGIDGPVYDVYDEMDSSTLKFATGQHEPEIIY